MSSKREVDMKARNLVAALVVLTLSTTGASSQVTVTSSGPQAGSAFGAEPIVRITSTFRTIGAMEPTQSVPDAAAQGAARRAFYAMAADECASLSEVFRSECRLSSVQMVAPIVGAAAAPRDVMSATAVYELRPLRQASSR
jgi:uncharacterized protein YcfJ